MSNRPSSRRFRSAGRLSRPDNVPRFGSVTRRNVLYGGGLVVVSATATGCGLFDTEPDTPGGDKGLEAPMLADRVEAGDLPPVEDRLPVEEDRLVVEPTDRIGVYGGTWRSTYTDIGDAPWFHRTVGYEPLTRWNREWTSVINNVAKSIEASADAREFQVTLRRGMKWSDGEPFTTADIEFAFHHVLINPDLLGEAGPHTMVRPAGSDLMELEIVDEVTFVARFTDPNGLWIDNNARQVDGDRLISFPRHYCEQLHPEFNENAEQEAADEGYESWSARFDNLVGPNNLAGPFENPDLPTLKPWIAIQPMGQGNARFERNPYYWKVDPEGSQLPYIDDVTFEIVADNELKLTNAIDGAYDFHSRHFNTLENRPVVAENRDSGDYRFVEMEESHGNNMVISLNLAHRDAAQREMYQDKDFRVALSHAINRQRLINAVFEEQGDPWQAAPAATSKWYDEEFATQFTEYDPDLANQILDDAGYERDGDGNRLRQDGEPITVTVHIAQEVRDFWNPAMELVQENWEAIGIRTVLDPLPRDNWTEVKDNNDHDINVWVADAGHNDALYLPRWYFAYDFDSHFGDVWQNVWRGGEPDEEPPPIPEPMARQQELYVQLLSEPEEETRDQLFREILQIAKEQFWVIGTVRVAETYGIVSNRLQNVGDNLPESATYNTPAAANPEQWFFSS